MEHQRRKAASHSELTRGVSTATTRVWYNIPMSEQTQAVLNEALRLPLADRAEVVVELLASLDGDADPDVEAAWAEEVERRARRACEGESVGTEWPAVRNRIQSRIDAR